MKNETNEQRHARWQREQEADQAAIKLGLAYREQRHGVCYWDKHASEAFRAGYEAGKKAQAQLEETQHGVQPVLGWVHRSPNGRMGNYFYTYEPHCDSSVRDDGGEKIAVIAATRPTTQGMDAKQWLQQHDLEALERFAETTGDCEGYDISKDVVRRLAGFGCLQYHGFGKYSITDFGHYVLADWERARELPFKTQHERDAEFFEAIANRAKSATSEAKQ